MKALAALLLTLLTLAAVAGAIPKSRSPEDAQFRGWLVHYLKSDRDDDDLRNLTYGYALVDLNGDGRSEAVVWASDGYRCGTGGCDLEIFRQSNSGWRLFSTTSVTRPPIELLATRTHGWHDLGVWEAGGGTRQPYEGRLRFNGKSYDVGWTPVRMPRKVHRRVIIKDATIPLFPARCRRTTEAPSVVGPSKLPGGGRC